MGMIDDTVVLRTVQEAGTEVSVTELLEALQGTSRRTLQRRIRTLVERGALEESGNARARRYRPVVDPYGRGRWHALERGSDAVREPSGSSDESSGVESETWPKDAAEVRDLVRRPLADRASVGYRREFLDAYEPGHDRYLPDGIRARLLRMGDSGGRERPAGTYGRTVLGRLLIDLSWASSRLEGNTYSRLDTRRLLEEGRVADGKSVVETQMILNHKAAIEFLLENIDEVRFDRYTILNLHALLSENLMGDRAAEGRLRDHAVFIGGSAYEPLSLPSVIAETFDAVLDKAERIDDPFEQSFFALVHLPYLQPFGDVNKRVSRLAANLPLLRANLCPLTFVGVDEPDYVTGMLGVYELNRTEALREVYLSAYQRSALVYPGLHHEAAPPDPMRLAWRDVVRRAVREIVRAPERDAREVRDAILTGSVDADARVRVGEMIDVELDDLHEGTLARYGLRPSELARWRDRGRAARDVAPGSR